MQDIGVKLQLRQGEADNVVPPSMGRHLARVIPDCQAKFFPNEGHYSLIVNHYEEILSATIRQA